MSSYYKRITHTVISDLVYAKKCDICGKDIPPTKRSVPPTERFPFFEISTSHHDWGNDSIDSIEYMDACSPECAMKFAKEYLEKDFTKNHSKEITIEHRNAWYLPEGIEEEEK